MKNKVESFWPSISDLMAGLMMLFLLIALSFMLEVNKQKENIQSEKQKLENLVTKYKEGKLDLYESLNNEFSVDLKKWNATLDKDNLSIRFNEPEIFFSKGSSEINKKFENLLDDFFPRYIRILSSTKYKDKIEEIRIEGHTSSGWNKGTPKMEAYYKNMKLSQERTRNTLEYVMSLPSIRPKQDFLIDKLTANGLSSSKRILNSRGKEDVRASRRVEFKIRTKAEKNLDDMMKEIELQNKNKDK